MAIISPEMRVKISERISKVFNQEWSQFYIKGRLSKPGQRSLHITTDITVMPYMDVLLKDLKVTLIHTNNLGPDMSLQAFNNLLAAMGIKDDSFKDHLEVINFTSPYDVTRYLRKKCKDDYFQHATIMDVFKSSHIMLSAPKGVNIFALSLISNILRCVNVGGTVLLTEDATSNFNFAETAYRMTSPLDGRRLNPASRGLPSSYGMQGDAVLFGVINEGEGPAYRKGLFAPI